MLESESCTVIVPICLHDSAMVQYLLYPEYHHAGLLTGIMGAWVSVKVTRFCQTMLSA